MPRARKGERGATAVLVAVVLGVLIAFLALAMNVGHLYSVRGELQNGSDAGALGGAQDLNGMTSGLIPAAASADEYARYHQTDSRLEVVGSPIELGHWPLPSEANTCGPGEVPTGTPMPPDYHLFCRVDGRDAAAALRINAVRVQTSRASGAPGGGAAPVFVHALLGDAPTADVSTEAVALTGGPCNSDHVCLPIVVGVGCLKGGTGGLDCPASGEPDTLGAKYVIGMASTSVRSAGWSVFSEANPSDNAVCNFLQAKKCAEVGSNVSVDTDQGNQLNGGCGGGGKKICDWIQAYADQIVDVPIVSFSGQLDEVCPDHYNANAWVVGFATVRVLAVNCMGGSCAGPDCGIDSAPCSQFASEKCVSVQIICNHISDPVPTGCVWTGTSPYRPVLVR